MDEIVVLGIQRLTEKDAAAIRAVDARIRYIDACGWFDGEIRETWNDWAVARYLAPGANGQASRAERDALLAQVDVIYGGWPYPLDLRARAPKLKWFHQRNAGASNLLFGDIWASDVLVTTSRGLGNTGAMAEYVLAGVLHFARGFHYAQFDRDRQFFDHRRYNPLALKGKTACVIGTGGIGQSCGVLLAALGMRVVGTRRTPGEGLPPPGFAAIGGPEDLERFLAESDVVIVACQWTPETTHLIDRTRLSAMKDNAILVNVARGEIVDEDALVEALQAGRLRGVALVVYDGEFERPPRNGLWTHRRVLITPHVSGGGGTSQDGPVQLFCRNLRAFIDGKPLANVLDWSRGY